MAKKTKTKEQPGSVGAFETYRDKAPTALQDHFAEWIQLATGYQPADLESFEEGVRLAVSLRIPYQGSPENKARINEFRAQRQEQETVRAEQRNTRRSAVKQAVADAPATKRRPTKTAAAAVADKTPSRPARAGGRSRGGRRKTGTVAAGANA